MRARGFAPGVFEGAIAVGADTFAAPVANTAPAIDAVGTLSYTPAPDADGSATMSVQAHDSGGVANGGSDTSAA